MGVTTLKEARQLIARSLRLEDGIYKVRFGKDCELSMVLEDKRGDDERLRIMAISLQRISSKSADSSGMCEGIKTGRGLRFGGDLNEVFKIYGIPRGESVDDGLRILGYDNRWECRQPHKDKIEHKNFGISWSEKNKRVEEMTVDTSVVQCSQFR